MSTALTTIPRPELAIGDINLLTTLNNEEYFNLGSVFPDPDLKDEQRILQCKAYCAQMVSYVHTAKDPRKLIECKAETVIETLQACISVDLPIVRSLGYVALIPYSKCMTLMIQYQGFSELILRSQSVASLQSHLVYKGDEFRPILGSEPKIVHVPDMNGSRSWQNITHAYCIAHHMKGPIQIEIMTREELEIVKKAGNTGSPAWKSFPNEMYRKAPCRRIAKRIRKIVGGPAQIALTRGLQIEDSQVDFTRLDRYKALDNERAREQLGEALASSDKPLAMPEPLPDRPDGWAEALGKTKVDLWAAVQTIRKEETNLSCKEWTEEVMYRMHAEGKIKNAATLDDPDDIEAMWDAIVNEKRFTLDTGEFIPDNVKDQ